jgi:ABC-type multidrug transport system fused ATPase/permease subunit
VEEGTHEELKSAGGIYQKIYETQSGCVEVEE